MAYDLRPYQQDIVTRTRNHMRSGRRSILIQAPTGSGKTVLMAYMVRRSAEKGFSSWFIVHRRELLQQSMDTFTAMGIDCGVIASGWDMSPEKRVQICSIQTLVRRLDQVAPPRLAIFDECHHVTAGSWDRVFQAAGDAFHIGLTATPERLDGEGLAKHYQVMVQGPSVASLIESGHLSQYKAYAPSTMVTTGVRRRMGDFARNELETIALGSKITGDVVDHYQRICPGKRVIVFAVSVAHSKMIASKFRSAGIIAQHLDGNSSILHREAVMADFRAGRCPVLSNCDLFGEGLDVPDLDGVILCRPTMSKNLFLQQVGRGMRPHPGKSHAIILDHAGNISRHGLPDEEREWSLAGSKGRKKRDGEVVCKTCPECFGVQAPARLTCEYCGHEFEVKQRRLAEVDGELVEIDTDRFKLLQRREQGKAKSFDELVELAKSRGYKHPYGWANYVWRGRQKRWTR